MKNIFAALIIFLLSLPLLMPWVCTYNAKTPVALYVSAMHANLLD